MGWRISVGVRVNVDNFKRAESDHYFKTLVGNAGVGVFDHRRDPAAIDKQDIIRMNRDTPYSLKNVTAKRDATGSVTVEFGPPPTGVGDKSSAVNYMPITPGWNYVVR